MHNCTQYIQYRLLIRCGSTNYGNNNLANEAILIYYVIPISLTRQHRIWERENVCIMSIDRFAFHVLLVLIFLLSFTSIALIDSAVHCCGHMQWMEPIVWNIPYRSIIVTIWNLIRKKCDEFHGAHALIEKKNNNAEWIRIDVSMLHENRNKTKQWSQFFWYNILDTVRIFMVSIFSALLLSFNNNMTCMD